VQPYFYHATALRIMPTRRCLPTPRSSIMTRSLGYPTVPSPALSPRRDHRVSPCSAS
jgi:hypothetical protein